MFFFFCFFFCQNPNSWGTLVSCGYKVPTMSRLGCVQSITCFKLFPIFSPLISPLMLHCYSTVCNKGLMRLFVRFSAAESVFCLEQVVVTVAFQELQPLLCLQCKGPSKHVTSSRQSGCYDDLLSECDMTGCLGP